MCLPLDHLLASSIALPLAIGSMLLFHRFMPGGLSKALALIGFVGPLIASLYLALHYQAPVYQPPAYQTPEGCLSSTGYLADLGSAGYAFYRCYPLGIPGLGIRLSFGLNAIALPLFVLTALVGCSGGIYTLFARKESTRLCEGLLLLILGGLLGAFASVDIFFMYCFHELALIPTFVLMGLWGFAGKRSAAMELAVYLSLGALIALAGFLALYVYSNCPSFNILDLRLHLQALPLERGEQTVIAGLLLLGLGILVSLFPFYSWAPRAYATAPAALAMMHAGVLKKFGLYALIQVAVSLVPLGLEAYMPYLIGLGLAHILFIGFVTLAQKDLKYMAGYSSIMHMGYGFLALACFALPGLKELALGGALLLMVGHGLAIGLIFLLADMIQRRTHTTDMLSMGGLCERAPVLSAFFVAAIFANIGLPGFINFWGEFSIFLALWAYNPYVCALAALGTILSAIYGLRSIGAIFFGPARGAVLEGFHTLQDLRWFERFSALLLLVALLLFGCFPKMIFHFPSTVHNAPLKPSHSSLP